MRDDAEVALANMFGEMARALLAEHDVQATLARIVALAVDTVDGCEHCGISMIRGRELSSPASSDHVPAIVDGLQAEVGEGPCVDALREHAVVQTGGLSTDSRWPSLGSRASEASGIESVLAFPLYTAEGTMGALNMYATRTDAFDDHDMALGVVFATHAALAWSTSRTVGDLRTGMAGRELVGMAMGVLMGRQGVSESEAFSMLVRASQRLNVKLRQVADQVVHPDERPPPDA